MTARPLSPIALIDDDDDLRAAMAQTLTLAGHDVLPFARATDALEAIHADFAGIVVSDVRMPHMSGIDLFRALHARDAELPVILVTGHGDVPMAVSALKRGAFDFIEKPFDDNALVDIVQSALEEDARNQARRTARVDVAARLEQLTGREREVMGLILAGKFNKVIADELNISMRTVEVHRARVFEKMGVRSAVELAQQLTLAGLYNAATPSAE